MKAKNNIKIKYFESFSIISGFILFGFIIDCFLNFEFFREKITEKTYLFWLIFYTAITLIFLLFGKKKIIKKIRSSEFAVTVIFFLLIFVLIAGIFKQEKESSGCIPFNNIFRSAGFAILLTLFVTNIWFAILNRLKSETFKDYVFLINHLGILILATAFISNESDVEKHTLIINKSNYTSVPSNEKKETPEKRFAFRLIDFNPEWYPAKIGIIENKSDKVLKGNDKIIQAESDSILFFGKITVKLLKYYENAVWFGNKFHFVNEPGSFPAALVEITSPGNKPDTVWLGSGSFMYPSVMHPLDKEHTLAVLESEPRNFKAKIEIIYNNGKSEITELYVNNPVKIGKFHVYLTDFDKNKGKWSDFIIVELVYDPWLYIVYFGIFLSGFGAILLIFTGNFKRNANTEF